MTKSLSIASLCCALIAASASAKTIEVSNQATFDQAQKQAKKNDTISWLPGTYNNMVLFVSKNNVTVKAKFSGKTIFTGASKAYISGSNVTLKGFQFVDGNIGSSDVVKITGSHTDITELNISGYTSNKYLVISKKSQYIRVFKCNFENRVNMAHKNILNIEVSEDQPGFHKIQYCSFRNFKGTGGDMGVEPIRIGVSQNGKLESKTIVEFCYFTACNGDGELISNKSSKNILRYNTFENNPIAELVLRHGSDTYVYGNFFLKGKGGIRIREGSNHFIFNNYFSELESRSITMTSDKSDPIKNIYILHNTFVNTSKLHLGGDKNVFPKKVVFANNLFAFPTTTNVEEASGKELWVGNMYQGTLGIPEEKGLQKIKPLLNKNKFGLYEIGKESPVVNSAKKNKIKLRMFKDLDADDTLSYDILKQERPSAFDQKDVGCLELNSTAVALKPIATSKNTGPSYM